MSAHPHPHIHAHGHSHALPATQRIGRAFVLGIVLNLAFVAIEVAFGLWYDSLALLADAGHNLSDVASLLLAWLAIRIGRWSPNPKHTYGWRRGSVLAAVLNALLLLVAMGALGWEAVHRFGEAAHPLAAKPVMLVAAIGIAINLGTAWLFHGDSAHDLNVRAAFLHMAADAAVSLGVVIAGALYLGFGWTWVDPVLALLIAAVIVAGTWRTFLQSMHLLFDGVPEHIDTAKLQDWLLRQPGVRGLHDLHVWALSTSQVALTVHLEMPEHGGDAFLHELAHELEHEFGIHHATIQIEAGSCDLACGRAMS